MEKLVEINNEITEIVATAIQRGYATKADIHRIAQLRRECPHNTDLGAYKNQNGICVVCSDYIDPFGMVV